MSWHLITFWGGVVVLAGGLAYSVSAATKPVNSSSAQPKADPVDSALAAYRRLPKESRIETLLGAMSWRKYRSTIDASSRDVPSADFGHVRVFLNAMNQKSASAITPSSSEIERSDYSLVDGGESGTFRRSQRAGKLKIKATPVTCFFVRNVGNVDINDVTLVVESYPKILRGKFEELYDDYDLLQAREGREKGAPLPPLQTWHLGPCPIGRSIVVPLYTSLVLSGLSSLSEASQWRFVRGPLYFPLRMSWKDHSGAMHEVNKLDDFLSPTIIADDPSMRDLAGD